MLTSNCESSQPETNSSVSTSSEKRARSDHSTDFGILPAASKHNEPDFEILPAAAKHEEPDFEILPAASKDKEPDFEILSAAPKSGKLPDVIRSQKPGASSVSHSDALLDHREHILTTASSSTESKTPS